MAREQQKDSQLQDILAGSCPTSLVLQPFPVGQPPITLYCDMSTDHIRPFVPEIFRWEIQQFARTLAPRSKSVSENGS
ncbi:hypothetical protein TNIN_114201 [Trichonephila inaurata madagascariensis]|uniref:Uncharacterized protein n=1 Tax=Trichonephila inaurata madagascariensis TaxID=2747483 RepID=A0A8X7CG33_9ARAC|nr:hypothetical protein TNIN_114201 [Trichonephila inaurata madagascariensis]